MAPRIIGVASKVGEKGVALKVSEKPASHLTPLQAPASDANRSKIKIGDFLQTSPYVYSRSDGIFHHLSHLLT